MFHHQQGQISKKSNKALQKQQQTTYRSALQANATYPAMLIQRAKLNPNSLNADEVLTLQETMGNRAVSRLLAGGSATKVQAKLTIGQPGDKYEQEADRMASQVVEQIHAPASAQSTQRQSVQRQEEQKEELQAKPSISDLQMSPLSPEVQREAMPEEEELQAKSILQRGSAGGEASTDLESAINSARGSGQPLDGGLQRSMGQAMGADFSGVKVHTDARSDQLNQSIQARAFTTGQDVFFSSGEYNPGSRGGQELIAHELTHVVQQNGGAVQRSPLSYKVTDSKTVEHVIQRYDMTYGALNNGCGTDMHVLIFGNTDPDLSKGSQPSVLPSWWPPPGTTERNYFQQYVVQGHLLNQHLGGPGDTMENLTPITRSTNTTHFKQIEDEVKKEVDQGNWVEYRVQADYTTHPSMSDLGVGVPANVASYLAYFAGEIGADYTVYDPTTGKKKGGLPGVKLIKNEGKHLKGTF